MVLDRLTPPTIVDAVNYKLHLQKYEYSELDSGVPVYLINAGSQEVIQIDLVFFAGNWYEEKNGVAAATNFLLRNGTTKKSALEINEQFEYYGAFCSRACYSETSVLSLSCMTKHLPKLLPLIEEIVAESTMPADELAIYVQNAKQRLAVNLMKGEFVAGRKIDEMMYGYDHPYGRYTNPENLDALQQEDVIEFYKKYYQQGKCAIFAAGNLPKDIQQQLNDNLGKLPLQKPDYSLQKKSIHHSNEMKIELVNDPQAVQGAIRLATPFPNRHHPDFKKVMVLNTAFGGYFGSRLMSNIREEKGYTYGIYSYIQNRSQESAWVVSTEAGKDVAHAAVKEIYKEMDIIRNELIDDEELSLVRNYLIGSILGDLDGPFHIMARWKNIILNNLPENYFQESIDAIKYTSAEELKDLANKYLLPEKFYELIVY